MNDRINISRCNFEKLGGQYKLADNVIIEKEIIENINCFWFRNKGEINTKKILLYLHGGCFVLGSLQSHQALVSHLSKNLMLPVLFVEYSLAPEKPFPAAVIDIAKVYQYLLARYPGSDIVLMGDSAGAGLAISVLSKINEKDLHAPKYLVMLSPWIDLSCANESLITNAAIDPILTKEQLEKFVSFYVNDKTVSAANPIETMYGPAPPTLIIVGSNEILLDDSKLICNKIAEQQTKVELNIYEGQNHVWMLEDINTEASKKALKEIQEFIAA
ncbi:alpha/beta hydrolase [Ferruginibacter sp.]|nr:alpha/beta hydrolase [Ferruginibacter sp.]